MGKLTLKKGFIAQKMGDELVIFDGEESMLYTFNKSAALIFTFLKKGLTQNEIAGMLVKKYGVSESIAAKDVSDFISELKLKKILKP